MTKLDALTIGSARVDLDTEHVGLPSTDVRTVATRVGGRPTNVGVKASPFLCTDAMPAVGTGTEPREELALERGCVGQKEAS